MKGHKHTKETREKISKSLREQHTLGLRKESYKKISISKKKNNWLKGKKGEKSPKWKGGHFKQQGYTFLYSPTHPARNNKGYIKRSHLVWFQKTGEIIKSPYVLHHINENKEDDRFENLKKLTISKHLKLHHITHDYCKVRGEKFKKGIGIIGKNNNENN